ncbi:MAG: hypothetical protein OHK0023_17470 [Anaerolineae bacterium]
MNSVSRRNFLKLLGVAGASVPALTLLGDVVHPRLRASAQSTLGTVVIVKQGGLTIHSYVAPEASFLVTGQVIETPNRLVVVDTQLLQTFGKDFRAYVDSIGKPVERHILSHAHPDHFLAANLFADFPFHTTAGIAEAVEAYIAGGNVAGVAALIGESEVPQTPRLPEAKISVGEEVIDGVKFVYSVVNNAEAPEHLNIGLPDAGILVVQDLVFSNAHYFPGADRENWVKSLEALRTQAGYNLLLVGHGLPASLGALDEAIAYLQFAIEQTKTAKDANELIAALQARYPAYGAAGILNFWQQFFPAQ